MSEEKEWEIACPECGEINKVNVPHFTGTRTVFCQECGGRISIYMHRQLLKIR